MNRDSNVFNSAYEMGFLYYNYIRLVFLIDGSWSIEDLEAKVL